jgi:BirA family biotin operon repressor/biotin-[acetyl-CoA-carboxylase] ligase
MYRQILLMLADGQRHTIKQLIKQLSIDVTVLEQTIRVLSTYGILINSPVADVYQLAEPLELLDSSRILAALSPKNLSYLACLEILDIVDSTNRHALDSQGSMPYVCLAEYQTAGRGRQGRQWISPYASGLCLSLKSHYTILNESLGGLNIALAVTIVRTLHQLGATGLGLKWPNDIWWQNRKLAGLLLETRYAKKSVIVIGIGINVKMPPLDPKTITQPWVDLETVLGHSISRNTLAAMLIEQCLQTLTTYSQQGLKSFMPEWHSLDLCYGQQISLKMPSVFESAQLITGTAWGIDAQGALLLQIGQQKQRYVYGEVSLHLEYL